MLTGPYGIHWWFNIVCGKPLGSAVLIIEDEATIAKPRSGLILTDIQLMDSCVGLDAVFFNREADRVEDSAILKDD